MKKILTETGYILDWEGERPKDADSVTWEVDVFETTEGHKEPQYKRRYYKHWTKIRGYI